MDFLDPKRKKSHRQRLVVGYLLVAIAISLATWLILNTSFGYWVDPKTGDVIQNGTVFIDSKPVSSNISIDGKMQGSHTSAKLVLPGGKQYSIELTNPGYRDWKRTISLSGGSIERLAYPLLILKKLVTTESQLYASAPSFSSQSPDKRWLLVAQPGQNSVFDLYDSNNPSTAPVTLNVPTSIITDPTKTAGYEVIDWASDDRHVLLKRTYNETFEFIMLDTTAIASSVNINNALTVNPSSVTLRDKKADQLYIYDSNGGTLRQGDLKNKTASGAILSNILAYKTYGSDVIIYAIRQAAPVNKLSYRIRDNDKATYLLKNVPDSNAYLLDVSEFDGTPYFIVGSSNEDTVFVYRDPLPTLKGQSQSPLLVSAVLRLTDPKFVSFSKGSKFVSAQSGNKLVVFDIEADRQYQVNINQDIAKTDKLNWMDSYRFSYIGKNQSYVIDFDGSNDQLLVPSLSGNGPYFSADYKTLLSIAPSTKAPGRFALTQTSLLSK